MGFFTEYLAKRRAAAEKARRRILPTGQIIRTTLLAAFLFASFMTAISVVNESIKGEWHPAEATTRVEKLYFSASLDPATGRQIPNAAGGQEVVVLDFRNTDGEPCSSFHWSGRSSREVMARAPEKVAIVYHKEWKGAEITSQSEVETRMATTSLGPYRAWVASSGTLLEETGSIISPRPDTALLRIGAVGIPERAPVAWLIMFGWMVTFLLAFMFWKRRRAIALVTAESKAKPDSSGPSAPV